MPIETLVSAHVPEQPALPFDPPVEPRGGVREDPGDELSFDAVASLLLQEVVRRSAAMDVRDIRRPRRGPRHAA
jgi:hypothetical protein